MSANPLLSIEGLTASVDEKTILHNVNLNVAAGETHVLMGPNGTGKSSILRDIYRMLSEKEDDSKVGYFRQITESDDTLQLSGGERNMAQLEEICQGDYDTLLLDEPTAALDPIAENDIYMKYNDMTAGKTSVFISHRLASTRFCDRIIFIADGNIAEEGTHESLLARGGAYAKLFEVQSRYYQEGKAF